MTEPQKSENQSFAKEAGTGAWIGRYADRSLLLTFLLILIVVALRRLDYAGDGVRHLEHILQSSYPALGEPRWILFPALLFAIMKPLVATGMITTIAGGAKFFCIFNAVCGFAYLVCLRKWLCELPAMHRAAVLVLAGGTSVFLTMATDSIEPTAAALIAVAGLTLARFQPGLSDIGRLTTAAVALAVASLVYQGMLVGFFLLPAIFPVSMLASRPVFCRVALLALAVPLIITILRTAGGDTLQNAVRAFVQGAEHTAASRQYSRPSAKNLAGVAIVGPAYAFASIPELRGLSGTITLLRHPETASEAIRGAAAWFCALLAFLAAIFLLARKRYFVLLFAVAGMMILPAIRMSQYSYLKYYVLLPFLITLIVPRLGVSFFYPACLGILLLLSNIDQIRTQIRESQALRLQVARELYPRIIRGTCFLTAGWAPPVPDWRGDALAWKRILNNGNAESPLQIAKSNSKLLRDQLKSVFCGCPAIITDSFIESNLTPLQEELSYFSITGIPLSELVALDPQSAEIFRLPKFVLYHLPTEDQRRGCAALE